MQKVAKIEGELPRAGRLAYKPRNELAHGSLVWPDDDRSSTTVALQGDLAAHVLLFACQAFVAELLPTGLTYRDWNEGRDEVVDVDAWRQCQVLHVGR